MIQLFDDQLTSVAKLRAAYRNGARAPILVSPTGSGKTVIFTHITQLAHAKGGRVLIVAHRKELVEQVSCTLQRWNVPHGVISPEEHEMPDEPVQVAMVQTLANRIRKKGAPAYQFDLVIIDECHHAVQRSTWGAVLEHNQRAKILGVTATPCRLDGRGLGQAANGYFDALIDGPTVADLIALGRLAPMRVFVGTPPDLRGVKTRGGDFVIGQLEQAMNRTELTGNSVAEYRKRCDGAPAMAFTVTIAHAEAVADAFRAAGYRAAVLTGMTPRRDRAQMIRDLGRGAIEVIASCNVISEGTDIPAAVAAILLRPTASLALALQQMGRALRVYPGKEHAIILDHAGNVHRHGLPTDPVEWSLDDRPRRETMMTKDCPICGAVADRFDEVCPECGYAFDTQDGGGSRGIPEESGEDLVEMLLDETGRRVEQAMAETHDELLAIAERRGYKPGWAWHVLKARKKSNRQVGGGPTPGFGAQRPSNR